MYGDYYSALQCACFGNDIEMLKFLVDEFHIDLNIISEILKDYTPFRWTVKVNIDLKIKFLRTKKNIWLIF